MSVPGPWHGNSSTRQCFPFINFRVMKESPEDHFKVLGLVLLTLVAAQVQAGSAALASAHRPSAALPPRAVDSSGGIAVNRTPSAARIRHRDAQHLAQTIRRRDRKELTLTQDSAPIRRGIGTICTKAWGSSPNPQANEETLPWAALPGVTDRLSWTSLPAST
jgi:hypothetical protein